MDEALCRCADFLVCKAGEKIVGTGIYDKAKVLKRTEIVAPDRGFGEMPLWSHEESKQLTTLVDAELYKNWFIGDFALVTVPKLVLRGNCQINAGAKVLGRETVTIGRGSVIAYDVLMMTSSDTPNPLHWKHNDFEPEELRRIKSAPITIGNECFVGAKSVVMPGVNLPDYTVVPAGSYVYMNDKNDCCWRPLGKIQL